MEAKGDKLKNLLTQQMTSPVHWVKAVNKMSEKGVSSGIELGKSNILCNLINRITSDIETRTFKEVLESEI